MQPGLISIAIGNLNASIDRVDVEIEAGTASTRRRTHVVDFHRHTPSRSFQSLISSRMSTQRFYIYTTRQRSKMKRTLRPREKILYNATSTHTLSFRTLVAETLHFSSKRSDATLACSTYFDK